jgi:glycosyltransferase involved in cell wall biosynthesis
MNLLIALITFNRLEYTKRTLDSLLSTISVPYFLVVADNNSTDGTQAWLQSQHSKGKINHLILNDDNLYPGRATNEAWSAGLMYYPEATHLMRLDNDIKLFPDWDKKAAGYFKAIPRLGQIGLDVGPTLSDDAQHFWQIYDGFEINPFPGNVGGPNIIDRGVWEEGITYDESRWQHQGEGPAAQEDSRFSQAISSAGWLFGHTKDKLAETIDNWDDYPDYFIKTLTDRGYGEIFKDKIDRLKGLRGD